VGHAEENPTLEARRSRQHHLARLAVILTALACLSSLALVQMVSFKRRYSEELGVIIPRSSNPLLPEPVQEVITFPNYEVALEVFRKTRGNAAAAGVVGRDWTGALVAAEAADDFEAQLSIVRAITDPKWPNGVCDRDTDDCRKPNSNISAQNSLYLSEFLNKYYLSQAEADRRRGRVARAYDRISRLGRILYLIDTPLVNKGTLGSKCCSGLNPDYIAVAFLGNRENWRNMTYSQAIFRYLGGKKTIAGRAPPNLIVYSNGVEQLDKNCPRRAATIFSGLARNTDNRNQRELSAYMALRASYSWRMSGDGAPACAGGDAEWPSRDSAAERWLKDEISLPGFRSDVREMEVAASRNTDVGDGD
jgi:hypothetical protein